MKQNMKDAIHEIGSTMRDIAAGLFAGAVVISIYNSAFWGYAVLGLIALVIGLGLQLWAKGIVATDAKQTNATGK